MVTEYEKSAAALLGHVPVVNNEKATEQKSKLNKLLFPPENKKIIYIKKKKTNKSESLNVFSVGLDKCLI